MRKKMRNLLVFICAAIFSALSTVLCLYETNDLLPHAASCAVYGFAAAFSGLALWQLVLLFQKKSPRQYIAAAARKTALSARLYDDYAFRTMTGIRCSLAADLCIAAVKMTAGLSCLSAWICAPAFYYMILSVAKALVLLKGRKNAPDETESEKRYREWKVYGLSGLMLSLTTLTLQGVIILIVKDGSVFAYGGTLIFAVASYDFYRLIYSAVYMIKMRRRHTPIVVSAKTISFSASLTAMLTLQAAMFTTFSDMDIRLQKMMNIITGTFVCAILITCGTAMIRRARKELKILWEETE